jgi:hypothetical protein
MKEYEGCDGVLWHLEQKEDHYEIDATLYRYVDKTKVFPRKQLKKCSSQY